MVVLFLWWLLVHGLLLIDFDVLNTFLFNCYFIDLRVLRVDYERLIQLRFIAIDFLSLVILIIINWLHLSLTLKLCLSWLNLRLLFMQIGWESLLIITWRYLVFHMGFQYFVWNLDLLIFIIVYWITLWIWKDALILSIIVCRNIFSIFSRSLSIYFWVNFYFFWRILFDYHYFSLWLVAYIWVYLLLIWCWIIFCLDRLLFSQHFFILSI